MGYLLYFHSCECTVDRKTADKLVKPPLLYMRWPHMKANQVQGLSLREIGGGFTKHHRSPSIRSACYAIAKPSTMVQKMQNIKKLRGHRVAVYCGMNHSSSKLLLMWWLYTILWVHVQLFSQKSLIRCESHYTNKSWIQCLFILSVALSS